MKVLNGTLGLCADFFEYGVTLVFLALTMKLCCSWIRCASKAIARGRLSGQPIR